MFSHFHVGKFFTYFLRVRAHGAIGEGHEAGGVVPANEGRGLFSAYCQSHMLATEPKIMDSANNMHAATWNPFCVCLAAEPSRRIMGSRNEVSGLFRNLTALRPHRYK